MTLAANTYTMEELPTDGVLFYKSLYSEDVSGGETILAASTGHTHYLTKLKINADAAMDVTVGSGITGGAVPTIHFGPIPLSAEAGHFTWEAPPGMGVKCTAATLIGIDATAGGTIWIEAHGKTCIK